MCMRIMWALRVSPTGEDDEDGDFGSASGGDDTDVDETEDTGMRADAEFSTSAPSDDYPLLELTVPQLLLHVSAVFRAVCAPHPTGIAWAPSDVTLQLMHNAAQLSAGVTRYPLFGPDAYCFSGMLLEFVQACAFSVRDFR